MKTTALSIYMFVFTLNLSAQTFTEAYIDNFRSTWEKEVHDSIKAALNPMLDSMVRASTGMGYWENQAQQMKNSTYERANHYKKVLEIWGFDIDSLQSFMLVEESHFFNSWPPDITKSGVVFVNGETMPFKHNPDEKNGYSEFLGFLKDYETLDRTRARSIIYHLLNKGAIESLTALAKKEMTYNDDYS
ncbi:MAG: hypothetical protein ACPGD8_00225, partial [Flavobacteriales bacterium]